MHMWKKDVDYIMIESDVETRTKFAEIVKRLGDYVHEKFPEDMRYYKLETRELSRGTMIDKDMIDYVICDPHWTLEETNSVKLSKGWECEEYSFNFMANMYYHKFGGKINDEDILMMAYIENANSYHYWKIMAMKK